MNNNSTTLTVGMDLGDKKHVICVIDNDGEVITRDTVPNEAAAIRDAVTVMHKQGDLRVVIETGTHSPWISRLLEDEGVRFLSATPGN